MRPLSVLRDLWCQNSCPYCTDVLYFRWTFGSYIVMAYFHFVLLCICVPFERLYPGGKVVVFSYFLTQDWYWLLCLPGYDWGAFFVNILYLVVLEWCLGVGWVLLFLSPLIICSSIPLRWCCTRIPLGCTWWHWLFKGREWYRHRVLLLCSWSTLADF